MSQNEFKEILLNNSFAIAYYSKKKNKEYATIKCKIKTEQPENDEVFNEFMKRIDDFYDNDINRDLQYKIKFDAQKLGFIGFTNIYNVVKCFKNDKTMDINEKILIDTTIIMVSKKLKFIFENIFKIVKPTKPIHIKINEDNENNEQIDVDEQNTIIETVSSVFN